MRILGVDPGSLTTGYGVVDFDGSRMSLAAHGRIRLKSSDPFSLRLKIIYDRIAEVLRRWSPQQAALESLIFAKNVTSAFKLGQARGAAPAANAGLEIFEYAPLEIKKNVTGYGRADKNQVRHMVRTLLNRQDIFDENVSDALAVAICHITIYSSPLAANRNGF